MMMMMYFSIKKAIWLESLSPCKQITYYSMYEITYMAQALTQLSPNYGVVGCLLVVKSWMLGLQ